MIFLRESTARRNETGFTLLETLLAVGLSALVMVAGWDFYMRYTTQHQQMYDNIEIMTDIEGGQQIMLRDLKALNPSYGAINILADADANGTKSSLLEYFPDVPELSLPPDPVCGRPCRTYTMRAPDGYAEIVLLLEDPTASDTPSMVYDPTWAFSFPAVANPSIDGPMPTFLGLNNANVVSKVRPADPVTKKPGYWRDGQLLMLDSPSLFRPTGSNMSAVAPRSPFFVGQVSGSQLVALPTNAFDTHKYASAIWDPAAGMTTDQQNLLNTTHPLNSLLNIDSAEHFLEWLPPSGGGQPLVRLRPVRLVRYSVELMFPNIDATPMTSKVEYTKRKNALKLWRQVYNSGPTHNGWVDAKKFEIAEYVQAVQFKRNTITDKAVLFNISKNKIKNGGGN